jgi:hypothetical protein
MARPLGQDKRSAYGFRMRTRTVLAGVGLAFVLAFAGLANAGQPQGSHPVVIELFTSQGCSDCPAADRIVAELAKRKDVLALSLPITYWDMLGWKDTFATEANTYRQKSYAKTMNRSGIYTPQLIVDGKLDVVGNQRDRVMAAIANRQSQIASEQPINLTLGIASGRVEIAIPAAARAKDKPLATIWVMRTLSSASVNVQQGENKNHQLSYANLVRELHRAGEWTGEAMKLDLPITTGKSKHDGIAVVLQSHDYGEVIAAAMIKLPTADQVAAPH